MSDSIKEARVLEKANSLGTFAKYFTFTRINGPGMWLALAALSAGCLVGSLGLGQRLGTEGLWVQTWAMLLGMFSLWAVSHITLNSQQSLFVLLKNEWNPSLGWWLAGAAMLTNFAWCMPQFKFGAEITGSILFPVLDSKAGKIGVAVIMLGLSIFLSFWYERSGLRSKLFQWTLRLILLSLFACLLASLLIALPKSEISITNILSGFIPSTTHFNEVSSSYHPLLEKTGDFRSFWEDQLVSRQRELTLITFSSTLGINLLFGIPLLLLGRGWKRDHNEFAKFNLFSGLFIPFLLCSSCLTLLSAVAHQRLINEPVESIEKNSLFMEKESSGRVHDLLALRVSKEIGKREYNALVPFQQEEKINNLSLADQRLAKLVVSSNIKQWILSFSHGGNESLKYLLGVSVILISFSTIVVLMVLNGHLVCEVLGKPHKGAPFQSGSLLLALASVGPFVWSNQDSWVADPTYFISLAILPYALLSCLLMLNSRELLGRECPKGITGLIINLGAALSFITLGASSSYLAWNHQWEGFPIGQALVVLIGILLLIGYFSLKNKKILNRLSGLETRLEKAEKKP